MKPFEFPVLPLPSGTAQIGQASVEPADVSWTDAGVPGWLAALIERDPDHVAVVCGAERVTYGELWRRTRMLASAIRAVEFVGAIAIYLPNDAQYAAALFACLAAERTCIVLDRHYPHERNGAILKSARPGAVLALQADAALVASLAPAARPIFVDQLAGTAAETAPETSPQATLGPSDAAVIVYTSGSTGSARGIALTLRMILRRARTLISTLRVNADDKLLSLGSPCTVAGVQQVFEACLAGATLLKVDLQKAGLALLLQAIANEGVTILFATPAVLRSICRLPDASAALTTLRCVHPSGDVLLREDVYLLRNHIPPNCAILVVYGATENVAVAQWFVDADASGDCSRVAAGYRLPGFDFAILDEYEQPVRHDAVGELWIRSAYISPGEWRDGELISLANAWRSDDPQDAPGQWVFRTGDLVRAREDGLIVVVGRRDRQIKMRGMRVEPYEIEACLRTHPAVLDAAVLVVPGPLDDKLVAFAATDETGHFLSQQLRFHVRSRLPTFMVPQQIHMVKDLPMLPGQKIDVDELRRRAAEPGFDPLPRANVATISPAVASAWARVLNSESLSADLTFAEAGGDSLNFLRLIFDIEEKLGRSIRTDYLDIEARPSDIDAAIQAEADMVEIGTRNILFLPGVGGDEPLLMRFRAVIRDNPFVVLRYPDWKTDLASERLMEDLCRGLADEIQHKRPAGNISLAGYSFGADVAVALAGELSNRGRRIDTVFVFDQPSPTIESVYEWDRPSLLERVRLFFSPAREERLAFGLANFVLARNNPMLLRFAHKAIRFALPGRFEFIFHQALLQTQRINLAKQWRTAHGFSKTKLEAPVVVFRGDSNSAHTFDLGWSDFCSRVTVISVPGDHRTIFEGDGLNVLARYFERIHRIAADT